MLSFLDPFIDAAYHLVNWLAPLTGTAGAIVAFVMIIRLCLHPLARIQVRGEKARAAVMPKLKEIQDKHRDNPDRLNQELAAFYGGEGKGMFAGCLPMLIQLPIFSVMYRLFLSPTVGGHPNLLLTHTLLGTPLSTVFLTSPSLAAVCLFALMAGVATWTAMRMTGPKLLRALPFGTVVFAMFVPLAAGIYLLTTTAWTAAERALLQRREKVTV
ncbi:membrane protein insertase YidC [Kutzneria buriramensis]|uniref:Membrane protein insertase YidC n=1 Tax=Kutzneria buriramensis TaxID=1045776 RepID=A0A3E0HKR4_9PSEU|nr:membrane protein insertase YidC [Kutzneria buriramensis]REH47083.1 YidC/Oxa1 family membrane protein insertase [Kutzneria buriramensis]